MKTNGLRNIPILAVSILLAFLATATAAPRNYTAEQITIRKIEARKNGTIEITFRTMAETMYSCPGTNSTTTGNGTELSFPRAHFKSKAKSEHPGTPIKGSLFKTVVIPDNGKPVFIRSGKNLVQIHPQKVPE